MAEPGPELDRLVAEAMGLVRCLGPQGHPHGSFVEHDPERTFVLLYNGCTSFAPSVVRADACGPVLDWLRENVGLVTITCLDVGVGVRVWLPSGAARVQAETVELALCLAVLAVQESRHGG